jgi:hypothetical protein
MIALSLMRFTPLRGRINVNTLTYLYVVAMTIAYVGQPEFLHIDNITIFIAGRWQFPDLSKRYIPWMMAPSMDIAVQLSTGAESIPWLAWAPTIIFHWVTHAVIGIFFISIANIFRKQWIDVEKVPFPQTVAAHDLIKGVQASGEPKPPKSRLIAPFSIGVLLSFAAEVPIFMTKMFPWFPDFYGWRVNTCGTGATWITPDSPLAPIAGLAMLNKDPVGIAIAYLAPLSVSFNVCFWSLAFVILMQVAYAMGYYTGITDLSGCGRVWCGSTCYFTGEPFKWTAFSMTGGVTGLTLFYLIINRHYIAETLRAALGTGELAREQEREPTTYRISYIMLLASSVLFIILWMIAGLQLLPTILVLLTAFIFYFAAARIFGMVGSQYTPCGNWSGPTLLKLFIWPNIGSFAEAQTMASNDWFLSNILVINPAANGVICGWGCYALSSFSSYRFASLTGTDSRSVFKVMLLSGVLAPLVALISYVWTCYSFGGITKLPGIGPSDAFNYIELYPNAPSTAPWLFHYIAGILFVALLSILHSMFVWFPFEPIGFLIATGCQGLLTGVWVTFLIAWVLKTITLRIGGSAAYENYGVPLVSGFLAGYVVVAVLFGAIGIVMFFIPF